MGVYLPAVAPTQLKCMADDIKGIGDILMFANGKPRFGIKGTSPEASLHNYLIFRDFQDKFDEWILTFVSLKLNKW